MKIRRKTLKRMIYLMILIAVVYFGFRIFAGQSYPDIITPKPVFGDENAKVKIIEFSDLQCPACKSAHPVIQQIKDEFEDDIRFEYYHFPLRAIHPFAQKAAEAVECANDQGMFFEYIDAAFVISPQLSKKNLKQIAADLGLDETFDACLDSGAKRKTVEGDYRFGVAKNVQGTPTFFINDKKLERRDYDSFKAAIEAELE